MKAVVIAGTVLAVAATVAGCRAATPPTATVTVTETAPAATAPDPAPMTPADEDDAYIALLALEGIVADRGTLIELGNTICEALDGGIDHAMLVMVAVDSGLTEQEGVALVAAAVVAYCPEHSLT